MLTKKQKEVLEYIKAYSAKHGYAPSLEETRKHFGLASVSTVHHYVTKLTEGGYLSREPNHPRSTAILAGDFMGSPVMGNVFGLEFISIPLVGSANCGPAELLAEENIEGYLRVPRDMVPKKSGIFALRAVGKSLNRANIQGKSIDEGDIVLVDFEDRSARDGDYILSIIDGSANLKKYKKNVKTGEVTLVSETTEPWKPIFMLTDDDWVVNGKIVGVIKKKQKK